MWVDTFARICDLRCISKNTRLAGFQPIIQPISLRENCNNVKPQVIFRTIVNNCLLWHSSFSDRTLHHTPQRHLQDRACFWCKRVVLCIFKCDRAGSEAISNTYEIMGKTAAHIGSTAFYSSRRDGSCNVRDGWQFFGYLLWRLYCWIGCAMLRLTFLFIFVFTSQWIPAKVREETEAGMEASR